MGLPRWMNFWYPPSKFGDVPHHNSTTIYGLSLSFSSLAAVRNNPPLKFFLTKSTSGRERGSRRIEQRRRQNFRSNCNRQRDPPPQPRLRRRRRRRAVIPRCERRERKYVASSAAAAPSIPSSNRASVHIAVLTLRAYKGGGFKIKAFPVETSAKNAKRLAGVDKHETVGEILTDNVLLLP